MGSAIKTTEGEMYNAWKVIEANVINPDTKDTRYINRAVFSKCICTNCNKTEKYFKNNELKKASKQCNSCSLIERNTSKRQVQIGNIYGYLKVTGDAGYIYRSDNKRRHCSKCTCLLCGNTEVVKMDNQLQTGSVVSCGCLKSKGEQKISELLKSANIPFDNDKIFQDLLEKTGQRLRFDFIIYNEDNTINRFVEFDGAQHESEWAGGTWSNLENFEIRKQRDEIKNNYCLEYGYKLIRIPYNRLKYLQLDDIMSDKYLLTKER